MQLNRTDKSVVVKTVLALLIWKAVILALAQLAKSFLPFVSEYTPFISEYAKRYPYLVGIWGNFDGMHYLSVARHGYEPLKQAFFPLFPVLIWAVRNTFHLTYVYSGLTISHVLFFSTLPFLYLLTKKDNQPQWLLFLAILLVYPTSFFYGAIYNDSTFFFLATVSIFFARKQNWLGASVFAGLAAFARLNGLALAVYIVAEYLIFGTSIEESWQVSQLWKSIQKRLKPSEVFKSGILWVSLVPFAFVSYLAFLQYRFGDWMTLFNSMKIWKQSNVTFPPIVVWRYLKIISINSPRDLNFWVAALELFTVIFYCHILLVSMKKIRLSYWIFILTSILIPWITGTFQGMPRYALHLYPFFLTMTLLLSAQKKWIQALYFCGAFLIMVFIITLYTRGYFVT